MAVAVAAGIFAGIEAEDEEIFPDPASEVVAEGWRGSVAKGLEHGYAAFVQAQSVALYASIPVSQQPQ